MLSRVFVASSLLLAVFASLAAGDLPGEIKGHTGFVYSVAFSPDGEILATGSFDNTIKLWDAKTGKELKTLKGHTDQVYSVAFNHDGKLLASGSKDKSIRIWDVKEGKPLQELKGSGDIVDSVAFSPTGKVVASGSVDKSVRTWNPDNAKDTKNLGAHAASVYGVAFSPNGKLLASCAFDGTIKVWDLEGGKELKSFSTGPEKGPKDGILQVAWGADNKTLYACGFDKYLRVWDALEGKELEHYGPAPDDLYGLAVSKDGNLVATAGYGGNLRLYDVQSGKVKGFQLSEPKKKNMITYCITFTPDGKAVVTGHEFGNAARVTPLDKFTDIKVEKEKPKPPEPKKEEKDKKETEKKKETKKADKQLVRAASVSERWSEIRSLTLAALTDTSRSCALAL